MVPDADGAQGQEKGPSIPHLRQLLTPKLPSAVLDLNSSGGWKEIIRAVRLLTPLGSRCSFPLFVTLVHLPRTDPRLGRLPDETTGLRRQWLPSLTADEEARWDQKGIAKGADQECHVNAEGYADPHGGGGGQHSRGTVDTPEPRGRPAIDRADESHAGRKGETHEKAGRGDHRDAKRRAHHKRAALKGMERSGQPGRECGKVPCGEQRPQHEAWPRIERKLVRDQTPRAS